MNTKDLLIKAFTLIGEDLIDNSFDQALTEERKLQYASMHSAMHVSLLPPTPTKRYYLIDIQERNGEQEYRQHMLVETPITDTATPEEIADNVVRGWYPENDDDDDSDDNAPASKKEMEDGGYYFNGGALFAEVTDIRELTEEEYSVLSKYNI